MTLITTKKLSSYTTEEMKEMIPALGKAYFDVNALPATIPAGEMVLFNGTLYRPLAEGESSLAAGTPWPVKGYKEYFAAITKELNNSLNVEVLINDVGDISWGHVSTGIYEGVLDNAFNIGKVKLFSRNIVLPSTSDPGVNFFIISFDILNASTVRLSTYKAGLDGGWNGILSDDDSVFYPIDVQIKVYPPKPL
jgi:hypothetical protein